MPLPALPQRSSPRSLLGKYFEFLKAPTYEPESSKALTILRTIWRLFAVHFLFVDIPAVIVISFLSRWITAIEDNKLGDLFDQTPPIQLFLLAVIFVPLLEETIFRLPLRYSTLNLTIAFTLIVLMGGSLILDARETTGQESFIWLVTVCLSSLLCTGGLKCINRNRGIRFFSRHLPWLIYGSTGLFALAHVSNYPRAAWIVAPILILPQLASGVLFAYVRIKFGFWWAFATHGFNNFLVTSPLLLTVFGTEKLRASLSNESTDVVIGGLRDQIVLAALGIWILGLLSAMLLTTVQLIQEWRKSLVYRDP